MQMCILEEHPERVVHQLSTKNKNSSEFKNVR